MPEPVKLTRRELLELQRGLSQLDAIRENEKDLVPLMFDSKVSYSLIRTANAVEKEVAAFGKLDRLAAREVGFFEGMNVILKDAEGKVIGIDEGNARKADAYQHRRADLLDEEVTVEGVFMVSLEQLLTRPEEFKKSKRNPVPQSVLNRLAPMLEEND